MLSAKANRIVLNFLLLVVDWRQEIKHSYLLNSDSGEKIQWGVHLKGL